MCEEESVCDEVELTGSDEEVMSVSTDITLSEKLLGVEHEDE